MLISLGDNKTCTNGTPPTAPEYTHWNMIDLETDVHLEYLLNMAGWKWTPPFCFQSPSFLAHRCLSVPLKGKGDCPFLYSSKYLLTVSQAAAVIGQSVLSRIFVKWRSEDVKHQLDVIYKIKFVMNKWNVNQRKAVFKWKQHMYVRSTAGSAVSACVLCLCAVRWQDGVSHCL